MRERIIAAASLCALVVVFGGLVSACSRKEHIRKDFGVKVSDFFQRQQAASKPTPLGLDPEEAALIHQSYRLSFGPPGGRAPTDRGSQVLVVEEAPADDSRRY